jgi:hypothetical protein
MGGFPLRDRAPDLFTPFVSRHGALTLAHRRNDCQENWSGTPAGARPMDQR